MHRAQRRWVFILAIAGASLLGAGEQACAQQTLGSRDGARRLVTDEVGRSISVPAEVRRIVTLAPDLTETVYALGLGNRLAGDTDYCDTPPAAKAKPHVGTTVNPSLEAIVALRPDLVLATTSINRRETVEALERLGIPVYTSNPHTVRGMLDSIRRMADAMGVSSDGEALTAHLQERLDALAARLKDQPPTHVLVVVWPDPLMSVGQNTFIADALRWAGAESVILSKENWPRVSLEEVARLQPEYIVVLVDPTSPGDEQADLQARPQWKQIRAVETGHVVAMDDRMERPAPGLIGAIETLARELHPEAFGSGDASADSSAHSSTVAVAAGCGTEAMLCAR